MNEIIDDFMKALLSLDRLTGQKLLEEHTRQTTPIKFIDRCCRCGSRADRRRMAKWEHCVITGLYGGQDL